VQQLPQLLAAASVAVVVGAGSRTLTWQLQQSPKPRQAGGDRQPALWPSQVLQQQRGQAPAGGGISLHWRLPLGRCIDAAPLLLLLARPGAAPAPPDNAGSGGSSSSTQAWQPPDLLAPGQQLVGLVCFACSHDGTIACVDVASGERVCWPGRERKGSWAAAHPHLCVSVAPMHCPPTPNRCAAVDSRPACTSRCWHLPQPLLQTLGCCRRQRSAVLPEHSRWQHTGPAGCVR
jgi:hypothetical protein